MVDVVVDVRRGRLVVETLDKWLVEISICTAFAQTSNVVHGSPSAKSKARQEDPGFHTIEGFFSAAACVAVHLA